MTFEIDLLAAIIMGLVGSGHCLGMCGGIASMLSFGHRSTPTYRVVLFYNLGRISSYVLFGALLGGTLASLSSFSSIHQPLAWLRLIASFILIAMGLYIGRWWFGVLLLERLGKSVWIYIAPLAKRFLPLQFVHQAFPLGFIWGWLPCGLVYSALSWAAASGNAWSASLIMLMFGLGTFPAMFAIGLSGNQINKLLKSVIFRHIGALLIISYGLVSCYDALKMIGFLR